MNQQQAKHLKERLAKARSKANPWRMTNPDMPAEVKKAKAVLDAWEKKVEKLKDARSAKVHAAVSVVEEAIFFGDPAKALAALKHFEGLRF